MPRPSEGPVSRRRTLCPVCRELFDGAYFERSSWLPEMIAAAVFFAVGVALLWTDGGDSNLRFMAAGGYVLLGMLYLSTAVRAARHNVRFRGTG